MSSNPVSALHRQRDPRRPQWRFHQIRITSYNVCYTKLLRSLLLIFDFQLHTAVADAKSKDRLSFIVLDMSDPPHRAENFLGDRTARGG